jgi:hypothetical protein
MGCTFYQAKFIRLVGEVALPSCAAARIASIVSRRVSASVNEIDRAELVRMSLGNAA